MKRMNIVFSTTRQWNPGDEIIRSGIRRVLDEILGTNYNAIIFNRNPDIRMGFSGSEGENCSKGFFENSLKPTHEADFVDLVVFAGTPEWCDVRNYDLYRHVLKWNIPVLILGAGGGATLYSEEYRRVIEKAKLLTVREEDTLVAAKRAGFPALSLPCPSLLAAPYEKQVRVSSVRHVGLIYQSSRQDSVFWGSLREDAHDFQIQVFKKLIDAYSPGLNFSIVVHYIDEVALAQKFFPGLEVHYSYEPHDYYGIYGRFDLVVGPRVHGIGTAASVGVPGIAISHDQRGMTCAGFNADIVPVDMDMDEVVSIFDTACSQIEGRAAQLNEHKIATLGVYKKAVSEALGDLAVDYGGAMGEKFPPGFGLFEISERLDRIDVAHRKAEALALGRAVEIDRLDAAFHEAEKLALERAAEVDRIDAAFHGVEKLALERAAEIDRLQAALENAQQLASERAAQINILQMGVDQAQKVIAERDALIAQQAAVMTAQRQ